MNARDWVIPLNTLIVCDGKELSAWVRQDRENETHVIEMSAYLALEEKLRIAVEGLTKIHNERKSFGACPSYAKHTLERLK